MIDQVLSIYAGTRGHLDDVPVNEVAEWETQFLQFMQGPSKSEFVAKLAEVKKLDDVADPGTPNGSNQGRRKASHSFTDE